MGYEVATKNGKLINPLLQNLLDAIDKVVSKDFSRERA
jgi:hypothetical protein